MRRWSEVPEKRDLRDKRGHQQRIPPHLGAQLHTFKRDGPNHWPNDRTPGGGQWRTSTHTHSQTTDRGKDEGLAAITAGPVENAWSKRATRSTAGKTQITTNRGVQDTGTPNRSDAADRMPSRSLSACSAARVLGSVPASCKHPSARSCTERSFPRTMKIPCPLRTRWL